MHLSSRQKKIILPLVALVLLLFTAWQLGWAERELRHKGKTVTQWLDSLELFHYERDSTGTREVHRSPSAIAADPAFQALLAMGDKAVPALLERMTEPAELPSEMTRSERWKTEMRWRWYRLKGGNGPGRPASGHWPESQTMRKTAAAFTLLALGTNAQAGFSPLMEAYAATPKHTSTYGGKVTGMPQGFAPSLAVELAVSALPKQRDEIREQIAQGLRHTNAECRKVAVDCARVFPELNTLTK